MRLPTPPRAVSGRRLRLERIVNDKLREVGAGGGGGWLGCAGMGSGGATSAASAGVQVCAPPPTPIPHPHPYPPPTPPPLPRPQALFAKRKAGLMRRAMELSVLTDCEVAVVVFSGATGRLSQYSSSPMGPLLVRYAEACREPHETLTTEQLYQHHVLDRVAAEEGGGEDGGGAPTPKRPPCPPPPPRAPRTHW